MPSKGNAVQLLERYDTLTIASTFEGSVRIYTLFHVEGYVDLHGLLVKGYWNVLGLRVKQSY